MGKLEIIRRKLCISKREAAKMLDLHYVYYCLFESCKKRGSIELWEKVQNVFKIPDAKMWDIVKNHFHK